MSSQNNNSKHSIKQISNYILAEQNIDIRNYTIGHLNQNHLFKAPTEKNGKKWQSLDDTPKKMPKLTRSRQPSKPYSSLSDINEILENFKNFESPSLSSTVDSESPRSDTEGMDLKKRYRKFFLNFGIGKFLNLKNNLPKSGLKWRMLKVKCLKLFKKFIRKNLLCDHQRRSITKKLWR